MTMQPAASPFKAVIKGSLIVLMGNAAIYVIGFFYHIPVVRILGSDSYGVWALAYAAVSLLAPLSTAGFEFGLMYYLSRPDVSARRETAARILRTALTAVLLLSLAVAALVALVGGPLIERVYGRPELRHLLVLLSASVPLIALGLMAESLFRAHGDASLAYRAKLIPEGFKLLAIPLALWVSGGDLTVFALLTLASFVLPVIYSAVAANRTVMPAAEFIRSSGDARVAGDLFRYSWPLMLNSYAMIVLRQVDVFFIGYYLSEGAVGVYRIAVLFSSILIFVPTAMSYLFFPVINRLLGENRMEETRELSERTLNVMIYLNIPLVCFFALFAKSLILLVYGREFVEGTHPLIFLSLAAAIAVFHALSGNLLAVKNKTLSILYINVIAMLVNIAANYLLIPRYAMTGASIAALVSSAIVTVLVMAEARRLTGRFWFPWRSLGIVFAGLAVILTAFLWRDRTFSANLLVYGAFLSFVLLWGCVFERAEWQAILRHTRYRLGGEAPGA